MSTRRFPTPQESARFELAKVGIALKRRGEFSNEDIEAALHRASEFIREQHGLPPVEGRIKPLDHSRGRRA